MSTFINHMYYHWETETQKTHCVDLPHMSHRLQTSSLYITCVQCLHPGDIFRFLCFRDVNLRNQHLEQMCAPCVTNKWTITCDLTTSLRRIFAKFHDCSPPAGQKIMCFLKCYCYYYRKADRKTLLYSFQWILHLT